MKTVKSSEIKANYLKLIKHASESHEPIHVIGGTLNGVLIAEEDWLAIEETLFLLSIPKMRESIVQGLKTPISKCDTVLNW